MKAKVKVNGTPVFPFKVKFIITHVHIETAIIALLTNDFPVPITIRKVKGEIDRMLWHAGEQAFEDWATEEGRHQYSEKAREVGKQLFPTFYTL